jgi:hypothetical protein
MILEHVEKTGGFTAETDTGDFVAEIDKPENAFQWIRPSEDIEKWTVQNEDMAARLQAALLKSPKPLSELQLWEALAGACSPEWLAARTALSRAEKTLAILTSPAFAPLGLIGGALDSHETNEANGNFNQSLIQFTLINETLRSRADLNRLLGVLLVQQQTLYATEAISLQAKEMTETLGALTDKAPKANRGLREKFQHYTQKVLNITRHKPAVTKADPALHEVNQ